MKYKDEHKACEVCGSEKQKPICEKKTWSTTTLLKFDDKYFHMTDVFCEECGLIYKNPMFTRESLDHFYENTYPKIYKPAQQDGIPRIDIIHNIVRTVNLLDFMIDCKMPLKGKKVLEIGSGMGILLKGMQSFGAEIHGVDTDARSCEISQKIFGFKAQNINFHQFEPNEKYDVIFCCNTLEHFYSPREVLLKIKDFLAKDGIVIIEIPSHRFPNRMIPVTAFFSSAHNYTFDIHSFRKLVDECGYGIDEFTYGGHLKSMLFLLNPNSDKTLATIPSNYDESVKRLDEQDACSGKTKEIFKELFTDTDVSKIINRIQNELPNTSNQAFFAAIPQLVQAGRNQQIITFLNQYREGQSEDIELCYGTALHYKGLAYRQMGDFLEAKNHFLRAKENYPRFEDYNFIKELKIDGIISDEGFSNYSWWQNQKFLDDLG